MNLKPDNLEERLQALPVRPVPDAWRQEILEAARERRPSSPGFGRSLHAVVARLALALPAGLGGSCGRLVRHPGVEPWREASRAEPGQPERVPTRGGPSLDGIRRAAPPAGGFGSVAPFESQSPAVAGHSATTQLPPTGNLHGLTAS